jgi:proteasome accessory factor BC
VLAALTERRRLHFDYRAATGAVTRRVVEPWGLASRRSLRYLTGYDVDRAAPRVFRLDRISGTPEVGAPCEQPIPDGRGLSLVPDERRTVTVTIPPARLADAAAIGGHLVDTTPGAATVRFDHLRDETVLGWSLRHGATITDPADLVDEVTARRRHILDRHRDAPAPIPATVGGATGRTRRQALSETRLRRLLTLPAWLESKPGIQLDEVAQAFGCRAEELTAELALLDLADVPGIGSIVEVTTDRGQLVVRLHAKPPTVQLRLADAFRILALVAAARVLVPPDEVPALDEIEQTVRKAVDLDPHVELTDLALTDPRLPVLRGAVEAGQVVRFPYRGRHDDTWADRRVLAATLRAANGAVYLLGHDLDANAGRSFRLDRMGSVSVADPADLPADAAGRPIQVETPRYVPEGDEVEVVLRLSARATWMLALLDPVGTPVEDGDEVVTRVRTDSPDWVIGHVLAAGGEAELVAPSDLRALVAARAQF